MKEFGKLRKPIEKSLSTNFENEKINIGFLFENLEKIQDIFFKIDINIQYKILIAAIEYIYNFEIALSNKLDRLDKFNDNEKEIWDDLSLVSNDFSEYFFNQSFITKRKSDTQKISRLKSFLIKIKENKEINYLLNSLIFNPSSYSELDFDTCFDSDNLLQSVSINGIHIESINPQDLFEYTGTFTEIFSISKNMMGIFECNKLVSFIDKKTVKDWNFLELKEGENVLPVDKMISYFGIKTNIGPELLSIIFSKEFILKIREDFNLDIIYFTIQEQFQFLNFLKNNNLEQIENVKTFINKSESEEIRKNRFKTFLSLDEFGEEFGEKILELGELESADEIFEIYSSLIDKTENIREELQNIFRDRQKKLNEDQIDKIITNLLKKGANTLLDFSNLIEKNKGDSENLLNELKERLEKYDSDMIFSLSIYKTLSKDGVDISPEELDGIEFSRKKSNELYREDIDKNVLSLIIDEIFETEADNFKDFKETSKILKNPSLLDSDISSIYDLFQMIKMYKQNFKNKPFKDVQEMFLSFKERILKNDGTIEIFKYKKNDEILSYFILIDEGECKEFVSFNTLEKAKGYEIGKALFVKATEEELKGGIVIKADAYMEMAGQYVENYGFVINNAVQSYSNEEDVIVFLELSNKNSSLLFKSKSKQEIIDIYKQGEFKNGLIIKTTEEELKNILPNVMSSNKYLLTRFFKDGQDIYICFENKTNIIDIDINRESAIDGLEQKIA